MNLTETLKKAIRFSQEVGDCVWRETVVLSRITFVPICRHECFNRKSITLNAGRFSLFVGVSASQGTWTTPFYFVILCRFSFIFRSAQPCFSDWRGNDREDRSLSPCRRQESLLHSLRLVSITLYHCLPFVSFGESDRL